MKGLIGHLVKWNGSIASVQVRDRFVEKDVGRPFAGPLTNHWWRFSMKKLLIFLILTGALTYGVLNYHFILMDKNIKVLKKVELTLQDTLVDARGEKKIKLLLKPSLVKAGVKDVINKAGRSIK
jgi:hypothetical protein